MLEQIAYESLRIQKGKQIIYQVGDLENLSATALYYGDGSSSGSSSGFGGGFGGFGGIDEKDCKKYGIVKTPSQIKGPSGGGPKPASIGTFSDFKPASNFGLGPGIAKKAEGFLERYRAPETDKKYGEHINLESYLPGKKKPFFNLHIDLNADK